MFNGCSSLIRMPDISRWEVSNVINADHIFDYCKSLINFPDISKWNFNKEIKKENIFGKSAFSSSLNNTSILYCNSIVSDEGYLNQNNMNSEISMDYSDSFYNN